MAAKKTAKMGHTKGKRDQEAGTTPIRGRFVIEGGMLNGYTVVDTENEVEPRGRFGMWQAINLRDRFNNEPEFVASEARHGADFYDDAVATLWTPELEFEVPPGREMTDEEIAELPILDPEVLS